MRIQRAGARPKEGFTLIKMAVGFHNPTMMGAIPNMWYDDPRQGASHPNRGLMTERGLKYVISCVEAMKKVLGDEIGLALEEERLPKRIDLSPRRVKRTQPESEQARP